MNKAIGRKLRELRHEGGFTQQYIADVLYISRSGYSHYEAGKRTLSPDKLVTLADFYRVTVDQLLEHHTD